ncbi:hypothetical protein ACLBX9_27860 [Methylobacterium sp. A49B]
MPIETFGDVIPMGGPAGPANVLTLGPVQTGSPGSQALALLTGTAPNQTLNLTLPQGPVGATGAVPWAPIEQWAAGLVCVASAPATTIYVGGTAYVCAVSHIAGTFAADLAAGNWLPVAPGGLQPWKTPPAVWNIQTVYGALAPADCVTYQGGCYVCSVSHTSTNSFDPTKWVQISAPGSISGVPPAFNCRLAFTSTTQVTLLPWFGNKVFINGAFYTIPNAGVAIGPSGTVGALMAVYATPNGGSVSLLLSATQPSQGQYGTWILGSDETKIHVGDVLIQSGTAFANYFVVSRYNRLDIELASPNVSANVSSTTPAITNANWTQILLVAAGEPVSIEFIGSGYNWAGSAGSSVIAQPFMSINGGTTQSPQPAYGPSNVTSQVTMYQRARAVAATTQSVQGSVNHWASSTTSNTTLQGATVFRTKQ